MQKNNTYTAANDFVLHAACFGLRSIHFYQCRGPAYSATMLAAIILIAVHLDIIAIYYELLLRI